MKEFVKNFLWIIFGAALMFGGSYLICGAFVWLALRDMAVAQPYIKMTVFLLWLLVWFIKAIIHFMKFEWLFGKKGDSNGRPD